MRRELARAGIAVDIRDRHDVRRDAAVARREHRDLGRVVEDRAEMGRERFELIVREILRLEDQHVMLAQRPLQREDGFGTDLPRSVEVMNLCAERACRGADLQAMYMNDGHDLSSL